MNIIRLNIVLIFAAVLTSSICAQEFKSVPDPDGFIISLLENNPAFMAEAGAFSGNRDEDIEKVALYFSGKMKERFYFNPDNVGDMLLEYNKTYPDVSENHFRRAEEMAGLYPPASDWNLPMKGTNGKDITAYELRHLARQHKAVDMAYTILNNTSSDNYKKFISYMVFSLEEAYRSDSYEKGGNDVFESFRCGYRVFNWLMIYNLLQSEFTAAEQFQFIQSFYYHGEELYRETEKFRNGNHHTKGVTALALTAILFPELDKNGVWLEHSLKMLQEHLDQEVNSDGFQFERSVHYHIGDIDNYFYVYYLAKLNGVSVPEKFGNKLYSLFESLTKIAYPDKTLPVLQDDTDNPWAEFNPADKVMALGAVLFGDEKFRLFSSDIVSAPYFWLIREEDRERLHLTRGREPEFISSSLPETGYYVMRTGWDDNDMAVVVSNGVSDKKPDHQHGDMLGLQLYAFGNVMLPNYQVRYYLDDYKDFKNSAVKNIFLADNMLQGGEWTPNSGGSGFGKFGRLPVPENNFLTGNEVVDFYEGKASYENREFTRKIIFVKDGFVIVKDNFTGSSAESIQQVWQGHFNKENETLFRSTFQNGAGLDILALNNIDGHKFTSHGHGKSSLVLEKEMHTEEGFITLLHPFAEFDTRFDERKKTTEYNISGWSLAENNTNIDGKNVTADAVFVSGEKIIMINMVVSAEKSNKQITADLLIDNESKQIYILDNYNNTEYPVLKDIISDTFNKFTFRELTQ